MHPTPHPPGGGQAWNWLSEWTRLLYFHWESLWRGWGLRQSYYLITKILYRGQSVILKITSARTKNSFPLLAAFLRQICPQFMFLCMRLGERLPSCFSSKRKGASRGFHALVRQVALRLNSRLNNGFLASNLGIFFWKSRIIDQCCEEAS